MRESKREREGGGRQKRREKMKFKRKVAERDVRGIEEQLICKFDLTHYVHIWISGKIHLLKKQLSRGIWGDN